MAKKTGIELNLKGTVIDASFIIDNPKRVATISPSLDLGLGGGIPEGTWVLLSGTPKVGKSTVALQIAANFQQQLNKKIYIGNVEGRIRDRDLRGIHNLDIDKTQIIQSAKGNILSAEDHLNIYMNKIKTEPNIVLIVDSTSALCEAGEMDTNITGDRRSKGPKLLASFCRQMGTVVPVQDSVVILIQHIIANTGIGPVPFYESGGNKIQFQADVKLRGMSFKHEPAEGKARGQIITWKIHNSPLGPPGYKVQSYLRYGYGLDEYRENITLGIDLGLIDKGGAGWITCTWMQEDDNREDDNVENNNKEDIAKKVQGEERLTEFLKENPDTYKSLVDKIKSMT